MAAHDQASRIRIVIIAPTEALDQPWIHALQNDAGVDVLARVGVVQRGVEAAEQYQPDVLVIDRSVEQAERALQMILAVAPRTLCIVLLAQQEMAAVRRLVAAGARDIVIRPFHERKLLASIRQVVQLEHVRQRDDRPACSSAPQRAGVGTLIAVLSPKGGVGTTTVAVNLAVALRHVTGHEVALVDFDLQGGDVAVMLNLWPQHTLHDIALRHNAIDHSVLDQVLVAHGSGINVLLAPDQPEQRLPLSGPELSAIMEALRARFGYIVVDCGSALDDAGASLISLAEHVLLVTTPEVPALKRTKHALDAYAQQGLARERIGLVLNRFPSVQGVTLGDIERHLRHPFLANLPSDGQAVTYAVNQGVPLIESHPQSWIAQSLLKLAAWIAGDKVETISQAPVDPESFPHSAAQRAARWRLSLRKTTTKRA